jgi:hypothetical protein
MILILHWEQNAWWCHYQELHLSIPLRFQDLYKALDDLHRRYPDAQVVIDKIEIKEAACVYRAAESLRNQAFCCSYVTLKRNDENDNRLR